METDGTVEGRWIFALKIPSEDKQDGSLRCCTWEEVYALFF